MEAYTWPDGETGYTNGTIDLNYSPETPPAQSSSNSPNVSRNSPALAVGRN